MKELQIKKSNPFIYEAIAGTLVDLATALCLGALMGGVFTSAGWTVYAAIALACAMAVEIVFFLSDKLYTAYVILVATILFVGLCVLLLVPAMLIHGPNGLKKFYKVRARRFVKRLLS